MAAVRGKKQSRYRKQIIGEKPVSSVVDLNLGWLMRVPQIGRHINKKKKKKRE